MQDDVDLSSLARNRLVHAIVYHLLRQVVGAFGLGVHPRPLANGLQAFQDFDR